jgi:hypothetical protein
MTPDQWEQIKEIFDAAVERSPEDRSQFLAEACAADDKVRGEFFRHRRIAGPLLSISLPP